MRPGNPQLAADWQVNRPAAVAHILAELAAAAGCVREAARAMGLHWRTLYRWLDEEPSLARAAADARERQAADSTPRPLRGRGDPMQ